MRATSKSTRGEVKTLISSPTPPPPRKCRSPNDENWGRVWAACDSGDVENIHPCCWSRSQQEVHGVLDKFFTIVFLSEMLMKMVADGIVLHEHAYLRNVWNWLDFFIVIISMIGFVPDTSGSLKTLKSLRTVRVLRPLRVIKRHPGLKIAVVCLISSLPAMGNVAVVVRTPSINPLKKPHKSPRPRPFFSRASASHPPRTEHITQPHTASPRGIPRSPDPGTLHIPDPILGCLACPDPRTQTNPRLPSARAGGLFPRAGP